MTEARRQLIRLMSYAFGYAFYGDRIRVPFNSSLPFVNRIVPNYSHALVEAAHNYRTPIIDVGANVGDTAILLFRDMPRDILAIEAGKTEYACLVRNTKRWSRIHTLHTFVDADENSLDKILQTHPDFAMSGFLKIDTDGSDLKVLRGAEKYLRRVRPAIWFEYDPQHYKSLDPMGFWSYLFSFGYTRFEFHTKENTKLATLHYPLHKSIIEEICDYAHQTPYFYFDVLATPR